MTLQHFIKSINSYTFIEVPFRVENHHCGMRLDRFLMARLPRYSRTEIQDIINKRVISKGRAVKKSMIMREGDEIVIMYPKREEEVCDMDIPVLFEDEYILAVNKPADLSVHSTNPWGKNDLIQQIRRQRQDQRLSLAHRIDRETSGIVLMGKSVEMVRSLAGIFAGREIEKEYTAIVHGSVIQDGGLIDLPIASDEESPVKIKMRTDPKNGAPSLTKFSVEKRLNGYTVVKAFPKTGRQHQIRVHLSAIGHPIVGDKIYKDEEIFLRFIKEGITDSLIDNLLMTRHALHASRISFRHPVSSEKLDIVAGMPEDMKTMIDNYS